MHGERLRVGRQKSKAKKKVFSVQGSGGKRAQGAPMFSGCESDASDEGWRGRFVYGAGMGNRILVAESGSLTRASAPEYRTLGWNHGANCSWLTRAVGAANFICSGWLEAERDYAGI